jgi:hypothetical protein
MAWPVFRLPCSVTFDPMSKQLNQMSETNPFPKNEEHEACLPSVAVYLDKKRSRASMSQAAREEAEARSSGARGQRGTRQTGTQRSVQDYNGIASESAKVPEVMCAREAARVT